MFKAWSLCLVILAFETLSAQEPDSLYEKAPEQWRSEIIPFPLEFAPQIKLKGREELRFAPGMFTPDASDFFSYSFVWWLEDGPAITAAMLQENLEHYFKGLYNGVSKAEKKDVSGFQVNVRATRERSWTPAAQQVFRGSVLWKEPFVTERDQTLSLMIAAWNCPEKGAVVVYFLVSPQEGNHEVWQTMKAMEVVSCSKK